MTNGLSHPYHLHEFTFILGAAGVTFHLYFAFYYIYIGSGTARFIMVETRLFPDCAGIAPTPSRWRHGCSRRLLGLSRYLIAFLVMPRSHIHGSPRRFYYGFNLTDDPGNANFRSPIRIHYIRMIKYYYV